MHEKGSFEWTKVAQRAFETIKNKLCLALILAHPNFNLLFEVKCDACGLGICVVLTQGRHLLAFFSKKLNGSRLNYSTYDKEFYTIVSALEH